MPGNARQDGRDQVVQLLRVLAKPLAQRRDGDHVGTEAVVEVLPEFPPEHHVVERPVRSGNDAPAEAPRLMAPHRIEDPFLQHLQELDLHRNAHVADLVEEDDAMGSAAAEKPLVVLHRTGEGPLLVSEELGLEHPLGILREVDGDEVPGKTLRETVSGPVVGDKAGAADGGCRGPLAGSGLT